MGHNNKIRIGKRDRFWLTIALLTIIVGILLHLAFFGGFADNGRPIWKSAFLTSQPEKNTTSRQVAHAPAQNAGH